jgi:16S rRNA (guanine966-N2)-methyltransferase
MRKPLRNAVQDKRPAVPAARNAVRIVGGKWRGRKLHFPTVGAIRPTPDRVRETLFNWLAPVIAGSRCLDLFAGSGALGFEALSRGAGDVVFVEQDPEVARYLQATLEGLACAEGRVVCEDALAFLKHPAGPFDVVFLDPPFAAGYLPAVLERLARPGWLEPGAHVYLEAPAADGPPALPAGWTLHRSKRAGEVGYHLARLPAARGQAGPSPARAEP